uniref:Inter-alpha-trypsin inhibitor heavy chain C-terminal domain-containing protein n=1 Tax=Anser brachyrhynchus TaxID=132585 RepID=A0A8B9CXZ5_9AVES
RAPRPQRRPLRRVPGVDGDPHFVATPPDPNNVGGHPVSPPLIGLRVHGHLVGAPPWPRAPSRPRTFLDALTLSAGAAAVAVTPRGIRVTGGGAPPVSLPFSSPARLRRPPLTLQVGRGGRLHLLLGPRLRFGVLRHRYGRPGALQRDHLGFYVRDGAGLSPKTGGLLGKRCPPPPPQKKNHYRLTSSFLTNFPPPKKKSAFAAFLGVSGGGDTRVPSPPGRLRGVRLAASGTPGTARLQRGEVGVTATLVAKRGPGGAPHPSCWLVPRPEVLALLGGPYGAFLAPPSVLG